MSIDTCDPLLDVLGDLGDLYPDMRFGQLVEMIALLCGEDAPKDISAIEDDQLLNAASHHARTRRWQLGMAAGESARDRRPSGTRAVLLGLIQGIRDGQPGSHLGQLVSQLAETSGAGLYDAEDSRLIAAARGFPAESPPLDRSP